MAITTNEALDNYPSYPRLLEWAKKARAELGNHMIVAVYDGEGFGEDFNNEDVIALCDEYDDLVRFGELYIKCENCGERIVKLKYVLGGGEAWMHVVDDQENDYYRFCKLEVATTKEPEGTQALYREHVSSLHYHKPGLER